MEDTQEQVNKLRINLLQGKIKKLEKEIEKLSRKTEIIERSLRR